MLQRILGNIIRHSVASLAMAATALSGFAVSVSTAPAAAADACVIGVNPSGTAPSAPTPWRTVFADSFDRCSIGSSWGVYTGAPGGNPSTQFAADQAVIGGNTLTLGSRLTSGKWYTGGVSNWPTTRTYGRWDVRLRATTGSWDTSYHLLLWPQNEIWPPEIDFAESIDPQRRSVSATVHYKDSSGVGRQVQTSVSGNFSTWHTMTVEWTPTYVRALINGQEFGRVTDLAMIPNTPMWLGMQVEGGACARRVQWGLPPCPSPTPTQPGSIVVDWVNVSSR